MAPVSFGVLMVPYQTIDVAGPLDILFSCSKELVSSQEAANVPGAAGLTEKAIDITFHHINETLDPVHLTAGMTVLPTTTCDTCPPLDYLIVGGTDLETYTLSPRFAKFIQDHAAAGKGLFATCTGAYVLAMAGVLHGKTSTIHQRALPLATQQFPDVKWVKKQWVVDGAIWTSGAACAGMDMMATWVRERYDLELLKLGLVTLDFAPRDVEGALWAPFVNEN